MIAEDASMMPFRDVYNAYQQAYGQGAVSEWFLTQTKESLEWLYSNLGNKMFNVVNANEKLTFNPAILSSYLQVCYRPVTIKDMRDFAEMFRYDWDMSVYKPDGELFFTELIKKMWGQSFSKRLTTSTFYDLKASTGLERNQFSLAPKYIPVKNGMLVLETPFGFWEAQLIPNSPEFYVTNRLPVTYDPNGQCPQILQFFEEILPNQERELMWLQEYIGYILYRDFPHHLAVMLLGDGSNGKSTLLRLISSLIGNENLVSIPVSDLTSGRWYLAELYQKMANIDADIEAKDLEDSGRFKRATGGDRIMGERKFDHPFYFTSYCKHLWSCNSIPFCFDDSDAFHRRWIIIQFHQQFRDNESRTDPNILDRLTSPNEMSGLLNWALAGILRLLDQHHFSNLPTVEARRALWNRLSNPLYAYLHSGLVDHDYMGEYAVMQFYQDFKRFCQENGLPLWSKDKVGKRMRRTFPNIGQQTSIVRGRQARVWKGIRRAEVSTLL